MKLNLRFLIAAVIVMMIYIPAVQAQANLTFSGGNGSPLTITLQQPVTYRINNSNCNFIEISPIFIFDEMGNMFLNTPPLVNGMITFSVNGGAAQPILAASSNYNAYNFTPNDTYIFGDYTNSPAISSGSTIVLSAGTITTTENIAATPPANGSFTTFIVNNTGGRCSENGVAAGTTAASVSISGRVLTGSRRGLSNALVYLTDSEGNTRTARTNSLGYYRFNDITAGQSVTVRVVSKRFQFAPQILNLNEELSGVNFLADN